MSPLPSILILCSRMDQPGGTERAIVNLATLLSQRGHRVDLMILDETPDLFYPLPSLVALHHIDLHFGITEKGNPVSRKLELYRHVGKLRSAIRKVAPSVVIGTEYHLTIAGQLAVGGKIPTIGWEHHHLHWLKKNRFWTWLHRRTYPRLDRVVCNNATERQLFEAMGCNAAVIPYSLPRIPEERAPLDTNTLLTIGWLIERKGIDLLPAIAEAVLNKSPGWTWKIIGSGALEAWLRNEIQARGLEGRLILQKPVSGDIESEYRNASVQVMLSRFECLPMVLLEGSSYGVPMVAFDCPTGPRDIIMDGESGLVVPLEDQEAMVRCLLFLMSDGSARKWMGDRARESSKRYAQEEVYGRWRTLFEELVPAGNRQNGSSLYPE